MSKAKGAEPLGLAHSRVCDAVAARLAVAGIADPRREARLLVAHEADPAALEALTARRVAREPMAYILGAAEFWSLPLAVSPATLIPRPDSETLIEAAVAARTDRAAVRRVLDLGTGTGCLLLAALTEFPDAWGVGTDRVAGACALAAANAAANGLAARAAFCCGNWTAPIDGRFDLVLSNPPYIPGAEIAGLMPEVARHEPSSALDGGVDGLDGYRALFAALPRLLSAAGIAIFEIGAGQALAVSGLAGDWACSLRADLAGHPRALCLQWPDRRGAGG